MSGPRDFAGPKDDALHDSKGNHRKVPPDGVNAAVWRRDMRLHMEKHQLDERVRQIAPDLFER